MALLLSACGASGGGESGPGAGEAGVEAGPDGTGPGDGDAAGSTDADAADAPSAADTGGTDGGNDAGDAEAGSCLLGSVGVSGQCMTVASCTALSNHTSTPSICPDAADTCCTLTPSVASNPAVPVGWILMPQAAVTADMTAWAVAILNDPTTYPMFSMTMRAFGSLTVMAIVEWHPPDFQNATVHRGVTLYEPG